MVLETAPGNAHPDAPPDGERRKILIVEDEFLLALHMELLLDEAGFLVVGGASEAKAAIDLAEATEPDLVMMDVRLRGPMDGVAAATEIWKRFGIRSLFLTGNADVAESARAAKACPFGVLEKPVNDNVVLARVSEALAEPSSA
jgi:two-component system, response regulator PdtaR